MFHTGFHVIPRKRKNVIDVQNQLLCGPKTALRYIQMSGTSTKQMVEEDEPNW